MISPSDALTVGVDGESDLLSITVGTLCDLIEKGSIPYDVHY
jgi:hypothetical protein